jgi:addiction module HigA family antidote
MVASPPPAALPAGVRQRMPVHPGRFLLRHYLEPLALTQTDAARRLGVSRRRVHELVHGKRAMSPDTAIRCAQAFGLPASDWLAMQSEWDAWNTWQGMRERLRQPARERQIASAAPARQAAGGG